jgi:acetoin utilization protein AcuB
VRQLPVVRKERLVGIVTDRDLRGAGAKEQRVVDVMTTKPATIASTASVDEAARVLRGRKIGAVPVVENNKLVGILSASDVLDAFVDVSGVGEATYRIIVSNARGKQAARHIRQLVDQCRMDLKWLHPDSRDASIVHLRLKGNRLDDFTTAIEAAGFNVDSVVAPSTSRA